ncbi:MAG: glycosyltransferase family 4 protein [Anaerolineales bacterium]|nr:glycosyltransferase family 4 protein [Anaerolineales bacterium]
MIGQAQSRIAIPSSPLRVLYVEISRDGTAGGSHQSLLDLVRHLDRDRVEPVVLFYENNRYSRKIRDAGVPLILWDDEVSQELRRFAAGGRVQRLRVMADAIARRRRLIKAEEIDLVHLNNSPIIGWEDWLPAARSTGTKCVANCLGSYEAPEGALARWAVSHFDRVVANSDHIARDLAAEGIPRARIRRVYPGVDTERVRERATRGRDEMASAIGLNPQHFWVVMVGHIRRWKGQHVLVRALEHLPEKLRMTTQAVLVGASGSFDKPYREELRREIKARGLQEQIHFLGERDDVPDLMRAADVLVHASVDPEPFGLVVVEGMALGKPVVASSLGGPAEIVTEGTGVLYDPGDPSALARSLSLLANDAQRRHAMGRAGRKRAERFSIHRSTADMQGIYDELFNASEPEDTTSWESGPRKEPTGG